MFDLMFFINSIMLGVGLAMDAFSISLADGLNDPTMKKSGVVRIAGVFAFFQALMPLLGWVCVSTVVEHFKVFEKFIPWIALILLCYIGGSMLVDGIKNKDESDTKNVKSLGILALMVQGVATSIDALSVGFTIAGYDFMMALVSALIIALVTFVICVAGVYIGKRFVTKLSTKATIFGGIILILIGIEIFVTGVI